MLGVPPNSGTPPYTTVLTLGQQQRMVVTMISSEALTERVQALIATAAGMRREQGMALAEVSRLMGCQHETTAKYFESQKSTNPSMQTAIKYLNAVGGKLIVVDEDLESELVRDLVYRVCQLVTDSSVRGRIVRVIESSVEAALNQGGNNA